MMQVSENARHFHCGSLMANCKICKLSYLNEVHDVADFYCGCGHRQGLHEAHSGICYFPQCTCKEVEVKDESLGA